MKLYYGNSHYHYPMPVKKGFGYYAAMLYDFLRHLIYWMRYKHLALPGNEGTQYKVTICAIFKNEGPYLREWLEYHMMIGVEHFYMYNNCSDDDYLTILKPYIDDNIVTLIDWSYPHSQTKAYIDCIDRFKNETSWIGFIDLDEFVVLADDKNICDFLQKYDKYAGMLINWKIFGSSGHINRDLKGLVIEDFTVCWPKLHEIGKVFFNTRFSVYRIDKNPTFFHFFYGEYKGMKYPVVNMFGHLTTRTDEQRYTGDHPPIQLNHYVIKSLEEYKERRKKGDVFFENNPHSMDMFYANELTCSSADYTIFKYVTRLKEKMK